MPSASMMILYRENIAIVNIRISLKREHDSDLLIVYCTGTRLRFQRSFRTAFSKVIQSDAFYFSEPFGYGTFNTQLTMVQ